MIRKRGLILILLLILLSVLALAAPIYNRFTHHELSPGLLKTLPISTVKSTQVPTLSKIKHVFIIVEENKDWSQIKGNPQAPFINQTLLVQGAYTSNYYNVPRNLGSLHPSEPNYIVMEAGKVTFPDHTFTSDAQPSKQNSTNTQDYFVKLLGKQGLTWKSYQEDIPGTNCPIHSVNNYTPKHNPYVFFQDVSGNPPSDTNTFCQDHNRPFSELQTDLESGNMPNYVFITPNLQNDMHDGTIAQADKWLSQVAPMITNSQSFQNDGALFITWDEGGSGNNPIGMIMLSKFIKPGYTNTAEYSHFSYLKTIQEIFNVSPLLGNAANSLTSDLSDFFQDNKN